MAHGPAVQEYPVNVATEQTLRSLDEVRPLYMLSADPLAEEVLIPGFQAAGIVDRMVGFFSSEMLASLAPGLASYVSGSNDSFRLIISPLLRAEDQAAIKDGLRSAEDVADRILEDLTVTEDLSEVPPSEDELRALYGKASGLAEEPEPYEPEPPSIPTAGFKIPDWLEYEESPFEHQGKAVAAWCAAEYRGVLEMATGSGKTITSMIAAHRLYDGHKPLLIVVATPYVPLIEQWCDEIAPFEIKPVNLTTAGSTAKRASELQKIKRRLRTGLSDVEAVVVSHDTLSYAGVSRRG